MLDVRMMGSERAMVLRWLLSFVLLGLLAVSAVACGGGASQEETARGLLERMVLTAEDLPAGVQRVSVSFSRNDEVAQISLNPEAELAKLEEWGRILGYEVAFVPGPDAAPDLPIRFVQVAVSLYESPEGAAASFDDTVSQARDVDWATSYPDLTEAEAGEVDRGDIAEDVYWVRVSGFTSPERSSLMLDDKVVLRVGRVRAFLRVVAEVRGATDRTVYMNRVEHWARLLSERIAQVTIG